MSGPGISADQYHEGILNQTWKHCLESQGSTWEMALQERLNTLKNCALNIQKVQGNSLRDTGQLKEACLS